MPCERCGKCCMQGPCIINEELKDKLKDKFKFVKDEMYMYRYRPVLKSNGRCKYLTKEKDGTYSCPVIQVSEDFRKHMDSGRCAFRKD